MKKIPIIALLIVGCAGNLASKEETIIKENFSIPNKNQNELWFWRLDTECHDSPRAYFCIWDTMAFLGLFST